MQGDMDIVDPLIDDYLTRLAGSPDPVEAEMRRYADERDGFPIVGPVLGRFLSQLSLLVRARRVFEVGSGFGYSAFWFARVLEPGSSVTLTDLDRENLDRARAWLAKAGLIDRCRSEPPGWCWPTTCSGAARWRAASRTRRRPACANIPGSSSGARGWCPPSCPSGTGSPS